MRDLVPDAAQRARVVHDLPRMPLSVLRTDVPMPDGWDRRPCAYLLLSAQPYAPSAAAAQTRAVADALLNLKRAMLARP
jgi:hypothetical protein